jgi:hypothetical protein
MAVSKKLPPFDSKLVSVDPDTLEEASFAMGKSMKHKTPITPKTPKKVPEFLHFYFFLRLPLKFTTQRIEGRCRTGGLFILRPVLKDS